MLVEHDGVHALLSLTPLAAMIDCYPALLDAPPTVKQPPIWSQHLTVRAGGRQISFKQRLDRAKFDLWYAERHQDSPSTSRRRRCAPSGMLGGMT